MCHVDSCCVQFSFPWFATYLCRSLAGSQAAQVVLQLGLLRSRWSRSVSCSGLKKQIPGHFSGGMEPTDIALRFVTRDFVASEAAFRSADFAFYSVESMCLCWCVCLCLCVWLCGKCVRSQAPCLSACSHTIVIHLGGNIPYMGLSVNWFLLVVLLNSTCFFTLP
jgi:hypothetical protein